MITYCLIIPAMIHYYAFKYHIDEAMMTNIIRCESNFKPQETNLNNGSIDRGIAQWNDKYHPEISNECAFNPECAIEKMAEYVSKHGFGDWVCYKIIKKQYAKDTQARYRQELP